MYLYSKDKYPKSYEECFEDNYTANRMYRWSCVLERICKVLFVLTILSGLFIAIVSYTTPIVFIVYISITALSAIITYFTFNLIAMILYALGTISESTGITAKLTLYQANRNTDKSTDKSE